MGGLPSSKLLREYSLRCRQAAELTADIARRRLLAHEALALAQLAERIDRNGPVAASVAQAAIGRCEAVLRELSEAPDADVRTDARQTLGRDAALHRARVWRRKAEECRTFAAHMMFRDTRASYHRLANSYETMAQHEEQRAEGLMTQRSGSGGEAS